MAVVSNGTRRARPRQYRAARLQAGDGGQGRPVQEIRRHRRVRHRDRRARRSTTSSRSWRRWSRPSAASTWRTSRRRSASRSRTALKVRMKIPVFHDDQHGTAIIVAAAVQNALHLTGKKIDEVKIVASGAGAAALACLNLLVSLGARPENIWVTDHRGRRLQGPAQADGPLEVGLRAGDDAADARRGNRRRRRLPRPLGRRRAQARHGQAHGGAAADHGARQSAPRKSCPKTRAGGATRRHDLHRAVPTIPTRSTTSCAFPTSSAARSMSARPPSTRR